MNVQVSEAVAGMVREAGFGGLHVALAGFAELVVGGALGAGAIVD